MVAIIAYLESRRATMAEGISDTDGGLNHLYASAFLGKLLEGDVKGAKTGGKKQTNECQMADDLSREEDSLNASDKYALAKGINPDGALYQLSQLASLEMAHMVNPGENLPPKEIEGRREVEIIQGGETIQTYGRNVDIVLGKKGGEVDDEKWVETKSYARSGYRSKVKKRWRTMSMAGQKKEKTTIQRQFFLDKVHAGVPADKADEKMEWRFQGFSVKECAKYQGIKENEAKEIRKLLGEVIPAPVTSQAIRSATYGIDVEVVNTFEKDFKKGLNKIILSRKAIDQALFKDFLPIPDEIISEALNQ